MKHLISRLAHVSVGNPNTIERIAHHVPEADSQLVAEDDVVDAVTRDADGLCVQEMVVDVIKIDREIDCTHVVEDSCGDVQVTKFRAKQVRP